MADPTHLDRARTIKTPLWVSKIILASAAILFSVIGIALLKVSDQAIEDTKWVTHTQEVISSLEELQTIFLNAESSVRAHVVSGSVEYRDAFTQSVELLPSKINSLQNLLSDNTEQVSNSIRLRELITKRLSQMNATLSAFQEGGVDNARITIQKNTSAANVELKKQFTLMVANEDHLLLERKDASVKSFKLLKIISVSGIPLGLLMVLLVYTLLVRELKGRTLAEKQAVVSSTHLAITVSKLEETSGDLHALSDYGSYLQSCKSIDEAMSVSVQILSKIIPGSSGGVYLMKASRNLMELSAEWGPQSADAPKTILPVECWCIRRSKPNFTELDSHTPPCTHIKGLIHKEETWLCLELASQGIQLGLVTIHATSEKIRTRFPVVEAAMEQLALSLSSLQLRSVLEYQSTRDDLTGLYNRRYMDESFRQLHARSIRHSEPYSILMLDVDHFKKFNDIYGHEGGDIVLREIGKILGSLRAEDIACRYGGEELSVALPNTEAHLATDIANRLREKVQSIRIAHNASILTDVSISIGVASYPANGNDSEDIRKKADDALYEAKRTGRNRVVACQA
jgi:diguanylate cyclase (GGDEF)-like protein